MDNGNLCLLCINLQYFSGVSFIGIVTNELKTIFRYKSSFVSINFNFQSARVNLGLPFFLIVNLNGLSVDKE